MSYEGQHETDMVFRTVVDGWRNQIDHAKKHKRETFGMAADDALSFYNGPRNWDELMTYAVATLTAPNKYTLEATGAGNALRRAIFLAPDSSGAGVDHPTGSRFAVVGPSAQGILKMTMPPAYIGQALYFKICTFNTFGAALQSLGDVEPTIYVPTGVPGAA